MKTNIPSFIATPAEIRNCFGSDYKKIYTAYMKRASKGISDSVRNFYKEVCSLVPKNMPNDEFERAITVPPFIHLVIHDFSSEIGDVNKFKINVVPLEISPEVLNYTKEENSGILPAYIAGCLSEFYIAMSLSKARKINKFDDEMPDINNSLIKSSKIVGILFQTEAYMVKAGLGETIDGAPSNHPERIECCINSISSVFGEGMIAYEIQKGIDENGRRFKKINDEPETVGIEFSDEEEERAEKSRGTFSNLLNKAIFVLNEADKEFTIDDMIDDEGGRNYTTTFMESEED